MASASNSSSSTHFSPPQGKKCRVCSDFKTWSKVQSKRKEKPEKDQRHDCPVDREELGQSTWTFLHTMAAYYPEVPSKKQGEEMSQFINSFSRFYPCEDCAEHMQSRLQSHPPRVESRNVFAHWMCEMHNEVNGRLGKKLFDCSKIDERWLDGWSDGSCD